jgi:hypothetical protein
MNEEKFLPVNKRLAVLSFHAPCGTRNTEQFKIYSLKNFVNGEIAFSMKSEARVEFLLTLFFVYFEVF